MKKERQNELELRSKVYVVHQRNSGTPEANEIQSIHGTWQSAFEAAIEYLKEDYELNREEAIADLGSRDGEDGEMDYAYIQSYELKK